MYFACWVDTIGFELAMGRTFAEIIVKYEAELAEDPTWRSKALQVRAAKWLNENYVSDAFYTVHK
jgi:hypothetical protein